MVYVYIGLMSIFKFPETRDTQPLLYLWSNIFKYSLVFHYNIILQPLFLSVRFQFKDLFKFIKYWSVHEFLQLFWIQLLFPLHWLIFTFSYSILAYSSDINQITWSPEKKNMSSSSWFAVGSDGCNRTISTLMAVNSIGCPGNRVLTQQRYT